MTLVPNCISYPLEVLLPSGGNMTPAELIWRISLNNVVYLSFLTSMSRRVSLRRNSSPAETLWAISPRSSLRKLLIVNWMQSHNKSYSLDICLASNLFDLLHSLQCFLLRSTSHIHFGIMLQQVLSSELTKPGLYTISHRSGASCCLTYIGAGDYRNFT